MQQIHRIAMWSGPRNISTAMLRSWGNRPDTIVCDEPLYAHYLRTTGITYHPGTAETLAAHDSDWRRVAAWLTGPLPDGKTIFYQKQMAHHLLPNIKLDWIDKLTNCFLIRAPQEMLTSLTEFIPHPVLADTGLPQQVQLYNRLVGQRSEIPIVIDARDILTDPRGMLAKLCDRLEIPFYEEMLRWPPGPRKTDVAWAPFWYDKVYQTTSFGTYKPKTEEVPAELQNLLAECQPLYEKLHVHRLTL